MKKKMMVLLATTFLVVGMFTGCASLKDPNKGPRIQSAVTVAAYVGTVEALRGHDERRKGFALAVSELRVLEEGKIDVVKLMEIVGRLPVKELKSERAQLIITSATILLTGEIEATPLEKLEDLRPVVVSIREGIERGLAYKPSPTPAQ